VANYKCLMVDVDGVIVTPQPGGWHSSMHADLGLSGETLQTMFFAPYWHDVVRGRIGIAEALAPVLVDVAPHLSVETLLAYWFERDSKLDRVLLSELSTLRANGVPLHLCTVQEHRRASYLWETLALKQSFDAMHYADDYGSAKPEAAFFHAVCARTGYAPRDLILLDDSLRNVEAARNAGWNALHWTGTRSLTDLLPAR
jgi:putative hydrolase of the HAD superfamily